MKRIGIITSGGDAPGMNPAIRAVVRESILNGLEVLGVHRGYKGLLDGQVTQLNLRSVSGIINRGGTILKTGRCKEIMTPAGMAKAIGILKKHGIETLVIIGGDGSLRSGLSISRHGIPVICIPASIDNDIYGTDETIGFDTAMDTAIEAVDRIRDTAVSHERIFIVEIMGREHGFLSLAVGVAAGAEYVLIPEVKYDVKNLCDEIKKDYNKGKTSIIIIFAEGSGNPYELAAKINKYSGIEVRVSSLGYIQRGGSPTARSRILASLFGAHAVELILKGKKNRLVVLRGGKIRDIPVSGAIKGKKKIDSELYAMVKQLAT